MSIIWVEGRGDSGNPLCRVIPEDLLSQNGKVTTEGLSARRDGQKNHKFYVATPVPLAESTQTVHFHKPTKTQLNTTLPSLALAQPRTLTCQLNLPLTPVWTQKLLLQAISKVVWV